MVFYCKLIQPIRKFNFHYTVQGIPVFIETYMKSDTYRNQNAEMAV